MNTEEQQDLKSSQDGEMEVSSPVAGERPAVEEEEGEETGEEEVAPEKTSESRMECTEPTGNKEMTDGFPVKTEREEYDNCEDQYLQSEEEGEPDNELEDEEEQDRDEEDGDEDREGEEEGETLNEPQDLSLADYAKYDTAGLPEAHAADSPSAYSTASRGHAAGKLNCDVCGLSCVSINVLLVHKRSHTGERPFHCSQCGASFTQKGNLLRHIKLHSGEKPFKCPMCSYACRRRDALSGHLRTHSIEKPYKCSHCGRSYKQRSSLEEHRERCHVYIQNKGNPERAGEDTHVSRTTHVGTERALLLDRLASNVAKRKSSMPQKFTGDNGVCLDLSFNRELIHRSDVMDTSLASPGPESHHNHQAFYTGRDSDSASPHRAYPVSLTRTDVSSRTLTNGHKLEQPQSTVVAYLPRPGQAHHSLDSIHSDRVQHSQPLLYNLGQLLGPGPHNGLSHPHAPAHPHPMPPLEALRVVRGEGEGGSGAVYPCDHCRVLFLDYVMFTIHMGCHGFRDPLECNVCGHRSQDRYEFSSHIARGEHRLELK
ncbi:zinc finger protein Aiolos isoform X2 [Esox lucius]|uniref:C2H2-type domain-containing protein n=2 Tax=Esox lucius TaxID=8010 RepID=A0A3P8XWH2_ESOLU|nr:zinc finger protein Aiolos isoform X2 [Esox lucius]XP_034150236.1 zinc finger protein Aiolos isoform X2 [Esox lucius]XP_034150237.1 zinc finger protein Aiolos isoform X2 [Esox lucius]